MTDVFRFRLPLTIVAMLAAGPVARAQDFADFEDVVVEEVEEAVMGVAVFEIAPNNFDQWVFGGGRNARGGRQRLNSLLTLQVESVDRLCSLSKAQKTKLELAGSGDIKRFFDEVEGVRKEFLEVRRDRQKFNQIHRKISPLQMKLNSGIFDDNSMVHKVLKRTLDTEQQAEYEQSELERRRFRYKAKVAMVVAMLEKGVPLRDEQRQKFIKLIVEETDPPRKFGQYDYYVVLYQASKLPEDKVKPIFDDAQWRALHAQLRQAKAMERTLKQNKFIP